MKAAVVRGGSVEIAHLSEPVISDGEILVEMRVCGVCGTDLYKLKSGSVIDGTVLGHELTGVVCRSRASHLSEGDRVFVPHHVPCGRCRICHKGNPTMCAEFKVNCMEPGGFAEFVRVLGPSARRGARKLDGDMSFADGALIEPLACCLRSVRRSGMESGDVVLVVGAGQVGTYHILTARALGAGRVIACDIEKRRLDAAVAAGADEAIDASGGTEVGAVLAACPAGVDAAFVTTENAAAVSTAIDTIREGGTVVLFAHGKRPVSFDPNRILKGERTITASYSSTPGDHEEVMQMMLDGRIDTGRIETISFPLDEAPRAVEAARERKVLRVVIENKEG